MVPQSPTGAHYPGLLAKKGAVIRSGCDLSCVNDFSVTESKSGPNDELRKITKPQHFSRLP